MVYLFDIPVIIPCVSTPCQALQHTTLAWRLLLETHSHGRKGWNQMHSNKPGKWLVHDPAALCVNMSLLPIISSHHLFYFLIFPKDKMATLCTEVIVSVCICLPSAILTLFTALILPHHSSWWVRITSVMCALLPCLCVCPVPNLKHISVFIWPTSVWFFFTTHLKSHLHYRTLLTMLTSKFL